MLCSTTKRPLRLPAHHTNPEERRFGLQGKALMCVCAVRLLRTVHAVGVYTKAGLGRGVNP
jgi:hypothetical protein